MRERVPIAKVRLDGGTQLRVETDDAVVRDYAEALQRGVEFPAVRLVYEAATESWWLVDGFHRLRAHQRAGREDIEADIEEGDLTLARLRACGANLDHGLRRSNETKRNVVREALGNALTTGWSNQRIAELCGVSAPFVASMREALGLTPTRVEGKNGKVYNLADKLTEAHIFACPSLAQVEEWQRQHRGKPIAEVLERYAKHLRPIEQAQGLEGLNYVSDFGLANAAMKGPGIFHALVLRIAYLLGQGVDRAANPSWDETLAKATGDEAWRLAQDPAISHAQRERALLAWAQWQDYGCRWPREEAATPALTARWDKVHAPREERQVLPPLTAERVQGMSREELERVADSWEVRSQSTLREAAVTAATFVAPDLIVTCPDPCCGGRWLKGTWCPKCRNDYRHIRSDMQAEANRTDMRRKLTGSPLHLLLEVLALPTWGPDDEELLWNRVAAWKASGCEGLPVYEQAGEADELDSEDEDLDEEDLDEDEDAA